jgi:hypothetical protein
MSRKKQSGSYTDNSSFRHHFNNPSFTSNEYNSRFSNRPAGLKTYKKGFFVDVKSEFVNRFNLKMLKQYNKKPSNGEMPKTSAPSMENMDKEAYTANKPDARNQSTNSDRIMEDSISRPWLLYCKNHPHEISSIFMITSGGFGENLNPPTALSKSYHPLLFLRFLGLVCVILFLDGERRWQTWYFLAINLVYFLLTLSNMSHFLFPKIYLAEELLILVWSVILVLNAYDDINPWWGLNSFWIFSMFEMCSYVLIMLLEIFMVFTMLPLICGTLSYTAAENLAR